jgi:4-amino-4-deoxy-L-arabinose transferase-like glycosyltransferase
VSATTARTDPVRRALWIALAVGLLGDAYLLCVRSGWFVRTPIGLVWPLAAVGGLSAICAAAVRQHPSPTRSGRLLLAGIGLAVAVLMLLNLVPPIARDELTYHLAVPALYIRAGHSIELPFIVHAYYPMLLEMLYLPLLAHLPEQAPKYLHMACGLAATALLYLYLVPRVAPAVALCASLLLLTTPTVMALGASAYVDLGVLLYSTVAVIGLLRWQETQRWSDVIVSALGAGCAASVKYNGVLVLALVGTGVLVLTPRRRWWTAIAATALFGSVALLPLAPWLVKNAIDTGNPVFPLLNSLIGGRPLPRPPHVDVFTYRQALYGESWLDILLVPLRVFTTGRDGDPARFDGVLNPLWLIGLPAALLSTATRRDRLLAGFAAAFLGFTLCATVFRSRYVLPVLVPLMILAAEWMQRELAARRAIVVVLAAAALVFNAAHLHLLWRRIDPLAYVLGRQGRTTYIARFVPEYPVTAYANANLPPHSAVYLAFLGSRGYYWDRPYTYDTYMSGTRLCDAVRHARSAADIVSSLRTDGITHIAAADPLLDNFVHGNLTAHEYRRWQTFVAHHLRPLFARNGVGLYAVVGT